VIRTTEMWVNVHCSVCSDHSAPLPFVCRLGERCGAILPPMKNDLSPNKRRVIDGVIVDGPPS
jgi:hypothetical protein